MNPEDEYVELLDGSGIKVGPGCFQVVSGFDEVAQGRIDDVGTGRVVVSMGGDDIFRLLEESLSLVGHPDRRSLGRIHRTRPR
jgi:hypothetical protein